MSLKASMAWELYILSFWATGTLILSLASESQKTRARKAPSFLSLPSWALKRGKEAHIQVAR